MRARYYDLEYEIEMTGREAHLQELKAQRSRPEYFEGMRQIFDLLKDEFPLTKSMWLVNSDILDALMNLEQEYNREYLVKGEPQ